MSIKKIVGRFGFELHGGKDDHRSAIVEVRVRQVDVHVIGPDGPEPTATISPHLMTQDEIDGFIDESITELEQIRMEARTALARANGR